MVISGLSFPKLTVYTSVQKHGKNQFTSWQRDNLTGFTLRLADVKVEEADRVYGGQQAAQLLDVLLLQLRQLQFNYFC